MILTKGVKIDNKKNPFNDFCLPPSALFPSMKNVIFPTKWWEEEEEGKSAIKTPPPPPPLPALQ